VYKQQTKSYLVLALIIGTIIIVPTFIGYLYSRQKAVIILNKPDSYQIGELVILDASKSEADDLIWRILPETDNFRAVGKTALFSSTEPIDYTLVIVARKEKNIDCKIFTLKYGESKSKSKSKSVNTDFEIKVVSWLKDTDLIENKVEGRKLAQSFKSIANLIDSGIFETVDDIILATGRITSDALDDNLDAWRPFIREFENYLEANPPVSIKDHAPVWRNMAIVLEKIYA